MNDSKRDRELGMQRPITRRDFLNGFSLAVAGSLALPESIWTEAFGLPDSPFAPEKEPGYYPPSKTGMRGSHDGSWEVAHAMRDGQRWDNATRDAESYDLIVVGGGISGLAAAYFFRSIAPKQKVFFVNSASKHSASTNTTT